MSGSSARFSSIAELTGWSVEEYADVEAVVDGDVRFDFRELGTRVDRAARALVGAGIEPGDSVAVWAPNIWEWVVCGLAVFRAGGVMVPVNTRFRGREAAYVLEKARVKLLFTVTDFLDTDYVELLRSATADDDSRLPDLERIVVLRGAIAEGTESLEDFFLGADEVDPAVTAERSAAIGPEDTGLVMFTSGTTGLPKGVMVANGAIPRAFANYAHAVGVTRGDRYLMLNPFFHAFGLNGGIVPALLCGATMLPIAVFDLPSVSELIQTERITIWPGPPAVYQSMLNWDELDTYDLSSLRGCVTGAATIPVEMVVQMHERLGFEVIITAYGMTETSGLAALCRGDESPEVLASTSGRAIPDVELRIVDDDGVDLPTGQPGELLVRGFCVMKGYLDDPEQTAATVVDGWLHTGDIAVMDENGYIDITDRKKDMFINGGFNAYPAEIERTMIEHPDIGQVAVIGIPDERLGEVGAAFVVPAPGAEPDPASLIEWCRNEMANYKAPRKIWIVDSLPLNPSNKVLKTELREQAVELLR